MKPMRWRLLGLTVGGLFSGFAIGMDAYATFFLPATVHRDGVAMFVANFFGFMGGLLFLLIILLVPRKIEKTTQMTNKTPNTMLPVLRSKTAEGGEPTPINGIASRVGRSGMMGIGYCTLSGRVPQLRDLRRQAA